MVVVSYRCAAIGLACLLVTPASAQLLARKDLSAAIAVDIAQTAMATCSANGYRVSATVVGRNGEVLVQIRGDGTPPHTMENSFKKAFTARTFRIPSGEMEERLKKNPQMGAQYLTGFTTARGALPIMVGEDVVGAAGVSGAEKDEACVKAALIRSAPFARNPAGEGASRLTVSPHKRACFRRASPMRGPPAVRMSSHSAIETFSRFQMRPLTKAAR